MPEIYTQLIPQRSQLDIVSATQRQQQLDDGRNQLAAERAQSMRYSQLAALQEKRMAETKKQDHPDHCAENHFAVLQSLFCQVLFEHRFILQRRSTFCISSRYRRYRDHCVLGAACRTF